MTAAMSGSGGYELSKRLSLPLRDREIVIGRTCARCGCEYEWGVLRASSIFTGSVARNRSTLISVAKFELLFNRQKAGSRAALGGSQSGSQRAQSSGDAERRPATIAPGERHTGRHRATSGDWAELLWEQEVAGSNPAIPTIFRICCLLVGVNLVASYCRSTSVGVAQRRRTLAPTSPLD